MSLPLATEPFLWDSTLEASSSWSEQVKQEEWEEAARAATPVTVSPVLSAALGWGAAELRCYRI